MTTRPTERDRTVTDLFRCSLLAKKLSSASAAGSGPSPLSQHCSAPLSLATAYSRSMSVTWESNPARDPYQRSPFNQKRMTGETEGRAPKDLWSLDSAVQCGPASGGTPCGLRESNPFLNVGNVPSCRQTQPTLQRWTFGPDGSLALQGRVSGPPG